MKSFTLKLQSPKAMNTVYAEAGLLTYSPFAGLPACPDEYRDPTVACRMALVMELTAAGQLRNYTVFPFNPDYYTGNLKRDKGS